MISLCLSFIILIIGFFVYGQITEKQESDHHVHRAGVHSVHAGPVCPDLQGGVLLIL